MATTALGQLRNQVRGETMTAEDPGYEEARRVYNAMIDGRPRVIVGCAGAEDVVAAVNLARESQLDLAVRGGSHSVPGWHRRRRRRDRLSRMQAVEVDPETKKARAQGGATKGVFNDATHAHGLAVPAASSPPPASEGSRSAAGSATSAAALACPATTCSRPRSSLPTARS